MHELTRSRLAWPVRRDVFQNGYSAHWPANESAPLKFSMVKLGLTLEGVATSLDLEEGLAYLDRKAKSHEQGVRAHR